MGDFLSLSVFLGVGQAWRVRLDRVALAHLQTFGDHEDGARKILGLDMDKIADGLEREARLDAFGGLGPERLSSCIGLRREHC